MDSSTVQRFIDGMKYEAERTAPPDGFPSLPDVPAGRYTDPAFLKLESDLMWHRSWLYACHVDELPEPGSFLLWKKTGTPIPSNDVWLAALSWQHSLPILSRDHHFDAVPGIQRIAW